MNIQHVLTRYKVLAANFFYFCFRRDYIEITFTLSQACYGHALQFLSTGVRRKLQSFF